MNRIINIIFLVFFVKISLVNALECKQEVQLEEKISDKIKSIWEIGDAWLVDSANSVKIFSGEQTKGVSFSTEDQEKVLLVLRNSMKQYFVISSWRKGFLLRELSEVSGVWRYKVRERYLEYRTEKTVKYFSPAVSAVAGVNKIQILTGFHLIELDRSSLALPSRPAAKWFPLPEIFRGLGITFSRGVEIIPGALDLKRSFIVLNSKGSQALSSQAFNILKFEDDRFSLAGGYSSKYINSFTDSRALNRDEVSKKYLFYSEKIMSGADPIEFSLGEFPIALSSYPASDQDFSPIFVGTYHNGLWLWLGKSDKCFLSKARFTVLAQKILSKKSAAFMAVTDDGTPQRSVVKW